MKAIGKILSFLYSILFGIILFTLLLLIAIKELFNPKTYENMIKNVDFNQIKLSTFVDEEKLKDKTITLEGYAIDYLEKQQIDSETASKIVKDKEVREVLSDFISQASNYFLNNDKIPNIDNEKIKAITNKYTSNINEQINIEEITNKINSKITELFQNKAKNIIPSSLQTIFNFLSSNYMYYILSGFIVISYLLLALLNWSFVNCLNFISIPTMVIGILFCLLRLTFSLILNAISKIDIDTINNIISSMLNPLLIIGVISIIFGIVLLIIKINLSDKVNKNDEPDFDIE